MDHENMTGDHMAHSHVGSNHMGHGHAGHDHRTMIIDFRRRFSVSLILTIPVLALSPLVQSLLGIQLRFPGDSYVLFGLSAMCSSTADGHSSPV
jgi:P-type Cu2+ transporter